MEKGYKLTKKYFSASTWKAYKDWLREERKKAKVQAKPKKKKKVVQKKKTVKPKKKLSYQEQLKDERWLKKRKEVLDTKGYICCNCGARFGLQVHHIKYEKGKMAWEYSLDDLVVLCEECHKKIHNLN